MSEETLAEALSSYLDAYNFGKSKGGYSDTWVIVKVFSVFPIPIPNIKARRDAVRIHDVNHILTGYTPGEFKSEIEIACYELGTGCGRFWFAWAINLVGIVFVPFWWRDCRKAFSRGRSAKSLYRFPQLVDEYQEQPVSRLRAEIGLSD